LRNIIQHRKPDRQEFRLMAKAENDLEKLLELVYNLRYGSNHKSNPLRYTIIV
jgi:hypothetical protein